MYFNAPAFSEPRNFAYPQQQLISLGITTFLIALLSIMYFIKVRKLQAKCVPGGYVIFVESIIKGFTNLCIDILGPSVGKKVTPYALYLFLYIFIGSLTPLIGFAPVFTSIGIPITMAFVSVCGIFVVGIKHQKWSFLKRYAVMIKTKTTTFPVMVNPFGILGSITPLISMSFRLWGNILAGEIVLAIIYTALYDLTKSVPVVGTINLLGSIAAPIFHVILDLFAALIQGFIFVILTFLYMGEERRSSD